jgi:uncharacterized membrane protein
MDSWYTIGQWVLSGKVSIISYLAPYQYSYFLFALPASAEFSFLSHYIPNTVIPASSLPAAFNLQALNVHEVPGLLFNLLVKLPLIASDTIIAYVLYQVTSKKNSERMAVSAAMLWYLNPLTIWVSAGWGMFDTLPALFTILSLYCLLERKVVLSAVCLVLAAALKYYAIILFVPLIIVLWRTSGRRDTLKGVTGLAVSSVIMFLPSIAKAAAGYSTLASPPSQTGIHYSGLTFWSIITLYVPFNQSSLSSFLIVTLLAGCYLWLCLTRGVDFKRLQVLAFALPIALLLLGYYYVGENFVVWILPFAALLAVSKKSKILFWSMTSIAFLSAVTSSLLPYYLLPLWPWIGGYLSAMLAAATPYRVAPGGTLVSGITLGKIWLSFLDVSFVLCLALFVVIWMRNSKMSTTTPEVVGPP